jgi:hypothetical protein
MNRLGLLPLTDLIETGATEPENPRVIWYDTTTDQLKRWSEQTDSWEPVSRKDML